MTKSVRLIFVVMWMILFVVSESGRALIDDGMSLRGVGVSKKERLLPRKTPIYNRMCAAFLEISPKSANEFTIVKTQFNCGLDKIIDANIRFKVIKGRMYLIDRDGFVSVEPNGFYSNNGDMLFSFKTLETVKVVHSELVNCVPRFLEHEYFLNIFTQYEFKKTTYGYHVTRLSNFDRLQQEQIPSKDCPGQTSWVFKKETFNQAINADVLNFGE